MPGTPVIGSVRLVGKSRLAALAALAAVCLSGCQGGDTGGFADAGTPAQDASIRDASRDFAMIVPPPDLATRFNVIGAESRGTTVLAVKFDAPPNPAEAQDGANYAVAGLSIAGKPQIDGADDSLVLLATSAQMTKTYTITVSGVTRRSDGAALANASATFDGLGTFGVTGAMATGATRVVLAFDAPPDDAAKSAANYDVPGVTVSDAQLVDRTVTLTTSPQAAQPYMVTVSNVKRRKDGAALDVAVAAFTGRSPFGVKGARSLDSVTIAVEFDAPPDDMKAKALANYSVPGLTLGGSPVLSGSIVTLRTSGQADQPYTVTVANVTRAADGEPLLGRTAMFAGTPVRPPTVTGMRVTKTAPDNGTTSFNTGTTTVQIAGTDFASVDCAAMVKPVKLDDRDGADAIVGTAATSCTIDSDTQITAVFPSGIRTNGVTGWNVLITNSAGSNKTSGAPFVPVAGLLLSEVFTGAKGNTDREYLEIYNPTATPIDTSDKMGIGLKLHIRNSSGTDANKALTAVTAGVVPAHGFLLVVSAQSAMGDPWFDHRDYTYSAASGNTLVANGGAYISLGKNNDEKVIDKIGWGTQPASGCEGTPIANIASDQSAERKPAGGAGHATDTDNNAVDFAPPGAMLTPRGTVDAPQP